MHQLKLIPLFLAIATAACTPKANIKGTHAQRNISVIGEDYFSYSLQKDPIYATYIGEHEFDHLLPQIDPHARARDILALESFDQELRSLNFETFSDSERIQHDFLSHEVGTLLKTQKCLFPLWIVDQLDGPHISFAGLAKTQRFKNSCRDGQYGFQLVDHRRTKTIR